MLEIEGCWAVNPEVVGLSDTSYIVPILVALPNCSQSRARGDELQGSKTGSNDIA